MLTLLFDRLCLLLQPFEDLPLKPIEISATTHFTFVVSKAEGVVNIDVDMQLPDLVIKIQNGKLHEAGPCLGLASDISVKDYQIAVIPTGADPPTFTNVKMMHFHGRLRRSKIASTNHSDLFIGDMNLVPSINRFHTSMQKLFVELGGHQITTKDVVLKPGAEVTKRIKTNEEQDEGFAFIREFGPRSNHHNQFVEWTERHSSAEDSPIFGWDRTMVEKNLRNYASASAVPPDLDTYPLSLADFKPWVLRDLVFPCLRECTQKGIMMHGLSGMGKTPLATAIGLAVSRVIILQRQIGLTSNHPFDRHSTLTTFEQRAATSTNLLSLMMVTLGLLARRTSRATSTLQLR